MSTRTTRRAIGIITGVAATVIGSLAAACATALLVLFGATSTLSTGTHPFATPTAALVTDASAVTQTGAITGVIGVPTGRVTVTTSGGPVFVGIALATDIDRYLAGVATDEVANFADTSRPRHPGRPAAAPPAEQTFWAASATAPGTAELTWHVQDGRYRIVVMNVDGTPGVAAQARADLELPNIFAISLAVLGGGLVVLATGVTVLVRVRRRAATPLAAPIA